MNKSFQLDIPSAIDHGIKNWQDSFYWPVSSPELFNNILSDLDIGYRDIISKLESEVVKENLIARYKVLLEYSNLLYT